MIAGPCARVNGVGPGPLPEGAIVVELEATLARFRGEPRAAFGLGAEVSVATVRAAFMALCKRYHPAKFARCSPPTIRLANEAFLAMRRAYDDLLRALQGPSAPRAGRGAARTPVLGVPIVTTPRPVIAPTTPAAVPPPPARPPITPPARAPTQPVARPPATAARPIHRGPTLSPKLDAPPPVDDRLDRALDHLRNKRWPEARVVLTELATAAPTDPRYRAYLHYLRGWEAFELGKDTEARGEWKRALACDPGLGLAKWALQQTGLG